MVASGKGKGAGIVDQNIDAAKGLHGLVHGGLELFLVANIPYAGQGGTSGLADFLGGGIDGAGQFGMGLRGFGEQNDVGAVTGGA